MIASVMTVQYIHIEVYLSTNLKFVIPKILFIPLENHAQFDLKIRSKESIVKML